MPKKEFEEKRKLDSNLQPHWSMGYWLLAFKVATSTSENINVYIPTHIKYNFPIENEDFRRPLDNFVALPTFDSKRESCFEISILDDSIAEPDEMFKLTLARNAFFTPFNAEFVIPEATIHIIDDDRGKIVGVSSQYHK